MKITELFGSGYTEPELIHAGKDCRLTLYGHERNESFEGDCRIIPELFYQKILSAIESDNLQNCTARCIIDITKENDELRRGIGDIMMTMRAIKEGKTHESIKNSIPEISSILSDLRNKFTFAK